MCRPIPARVRHLAAEPEQRFAQDAELARKLNEAHGRLRGANDRLWWGIHPDGIVVVYDQHPAAVDVAFADRSEVLGAPDALEAIQETHWQIHKAHHDYQHAAEDRPQLAADVGEIIRTLLDELVAAGWSEAEARNANAATLAAARPWDVARVDADGDPIEEVLALLTRPRSQDSSAGSKQLRSGDPAFAEASILHPGDMSEWQATVYLLTGCEEVSAALGGSVLADRSIAPVNTGAGRNADVHGVLARRRCCEGRRTSRTSTGGAPGSRTSSKSPTSGFGSMPVTCASRCSRFATVTAGGRQGVR